MDLTFCMVPSDFLNDDGQSVFRITACFGSDEENNFRKDKILCDWSCKEELDNGLIRYEMHNIYNEDNKEKKKYYYRDMGRLDNCNITNIQFIDNDNKITNINRKVLSESLTSAGIHKYKLIYHGENYISDGNEMIVEDINIE